MSLSDGKLLQRGPVKLGAANRFDGLASQLKIKRVMVGATGVECGLAVWTSVVTSQIAVDGE